MADDIAFRSQEYAQRVSESIEPAQQRMTEAIRFNVGTLGQGLQMGMERQKIALAQREQQIRDTMSASQLALDRIRREQAAEDLRYAKELHGVDMIAAQKHAAVAQGEVVVEQSRLAKAKAQKALEELGFHRFDLDENTDEEIAVAESLGIEVESGSAEGPRTTGRMLPEEGRKDAAKRLKDIREGKEKLRGEYRLQEALIRAEQRNVELEQRLKIVEMQLGSREKMQTQAEGVKVSEGAKEREVKGSEGEKTRESREGIAEKGITSRESIAEKDRDVDRGTLNVREATEERNRIMLQLRVLEKQRAFGTPAGQQKMEALFRQLQSLNTRLTGTTVNQDVARALGDIYGTK
jgi:hypothetical protein